MCSELRTSKDVRTSPSVLARQFSSDQAFTYLLEAWVAILTSLIFEPWLDSFYVQCCDNEASRHALLKGVGKHQPLNCLIAAHWTWHNRRSLAHRLERVPTKANISDGISRFEHVEEATDWVKLDLPLQALTSRAAKIIGDISLSASVGFSEMPEVTRFHKRLFIAPRPVRPLEPPDATTTDGKQSVLPEMTNHIPVRNDELRIDFERRSIDMQTYATVVEAGGKRVCVRQGFMALSVRSSLSCSTCVCAK